MTSGLTRAHQSSGTLTVRTDLAYLDALSETVMTMASLVARFEMKRFNLSPILAVLALNGTNVSPP